jgi:hypothetical protein
MEEMSAAFPGEAPAEKYTLEPWRARHKPLWEARLAATNELLRYCGRQVPRECGDPFMGGAGPDAADERFGLLTSPARVRMVRLWPQMTAEIDVNWPPNFDDLH